MVFYLSLRTDSCAVFLGYDGKVMETVIIGTLALAIEAMVGYPSWLQHWAGHPVQGFGWLIARLEHTLNRETISARSRRLRGVFALAVLVGVGLLIGLVLNEVTFMALPYLPALVLRAIIASSLLAQRSLYEHVNAVGIAAQQGGISAARQAVSRIVGRNPQTLDEAGVMRAAIESLAENFSDGVVAPAFWCLLFGLPGLLVYKAVNTADSMIGHRTARYEAYGWASARLDDLLNLPGSRLAALWLVLAAAVTRGAAAVAALRAVSRDAGLHRSPNAGWPEAAMAGALGLRLGGPRVYGEAQIQDAWMGDGSPCASLSDLNRALSLYRRACLLQFMVALLCVVGLVLA